MGSVSLEKFFSKKKPWSKRKDIFLDDYIPPYIHKIASQVRHPGRLTIVDGFAGAGRFDSGEDGSPLIISRHVENARPHARRLTDVIAIEKSPTLYKRLALNLEPFPFTQALNSEFTTCVDDLVRRGQASDSAVFLYLDPFAVKGLKFTDVERIAQALRVGNSVELLLNFNVGAFMRAAYKVLRLNVDDLADSDFESFADEDQATIDTLNAFAGGEWWIECVQEKASFEARIGRFLDAYKGVTERTFGHSTSFPIFKEWGHKVPAYVMVFASRHPIALRLMNNAACKARDALADETPTQDGYLWETRPIALVPDARQTREMALKVVLSLEGRRRREDLVDKIIHEHPHVLHSSDWSKQLREIAEAGEIRYESSKGNWNKDTLIWRCK